MKGTFTLLFLLLFTFITAAQEHQQQRQKVDPMNHLKEVVVTGEFQPQSLKNSVYKTRVINQETIRLRAASNIQQLLTTELGFRFTNDMTLGTSDIYLMGMSGRNVKILLDGVAMIDRSDTRESLNQIDINTIERIEIVEGPLSVSYGSDALAGVINIITKKPGSELLNLSARLQEETAGNEYSPFSKAGSHLQNISGSYQKGVWGFMGGLTHLDFNGFNVPSPLATAEEIQSDLNRWKPKEQWLANASVGYQGEQLKLGFKTTYVDEQIFSKGAYNTNNYKALNQHYETKRFSNQLQADYQVNDHLALHGVLAQADLKRRTRSELHDYSTGIAETAVGAGQQDLSKFSSTSFRSTAFYIISDRVAFQPGIALNIDQSSGDRIEGSPTIRDYAFFISAELKPFKSLAVRPGLRFIKNSVYDAPPVIPSLNTKLTLNKNVDLRLGYANGFRSPALRELYYDFFDASHAIMGNKNLKAEQSDSFTGSISFTKDPRQHLNFRSVLSSFYNHFKNRIDYGVNAENPTVTTLINISSFKTIGGTFENSVTVNNFQASLGFSYIGTHNRYDKMIQKSGESAGYAWTGELNSNLSYRFSKPGTTVNLSYKFTGDKPFYVLHSAATSDYVTLEKTGSFHTADLMLTQNLLKYLTLNAGVKNLFDVTTISNTALFTGAAHSSGGPIPLYYGRSYVLGLSFNLHGN